MPETPHPPQINHIPLTAIKTDALPRDRSTLNQNALDELQASIATDGLRQPIEVWRLSNPQSDETGRTCDYGLISGLRRLTAHVNLADLRRNGDYTTIAAFIRTPVDYPAALAAMVTENEIRTQITPWEKADLILQSVALAIFDTPDAAIATLFPQSSKVTRSRLRAITSVVEELSEVITDGPSHSLRHLLRIASALRADFGHVIWTALTEHPDKSPAAQMELLQNILTEAELSLSQPQRTDPPPPRRAKRVIAPRDGLTIRREWLPNGWRLVFTGPEAKGMMIESVMGEIERMYGPG